MIIVETIARLMVFSAAVMVALKLVDGCEWLWILLTAVQLISSVAAMVYAFSR